MGETEFVEIANIIADRLLKPEDDAVATDCRRRVAALCESFPLYPHLNMPVPALA
jgi:glycine hydroxymethyltransferase